MKITSSAFEDNTLIPKKYTCEGENISPHLHVSGMPQETKSMALIVSDPDAPSGDFVHWLVWNISPDMEEVGEGTIPDGAVEGFNDFGAVGWGGPCPPSGMHRYEFHAYALDSLIDLPETANKTDLRSELGGRILDEAVLIGLYTLAA